MTAPSRERVTLRRACDRLFVGLVATVVVVELPRGILYLETFEGAGRAVPFSFVLATVAGLLPSLAVAALGAGLAAAALRSPRHAGVALAGVPLVVAYVYTGIVLPWDRTAYAVARTALDLVLALPVAGGALADLLFGGRSLARETLWRAFLIHYGVVALAALGLAGAALRRARNRATGDP